MQFVRNLFPDAKLWQVLYGETPKSESQKLWNARTGMKSVAPSDVQFVTKTKSNIEQNLMIGFGV